MVRVFQKIAVIPIGNFFGDIVAYPGATVGAGNKILLVPLESSKYGLLALKPGRPPVGSKVIVLPVGGDKNNVVAIAANLCDIEGAAYAYLDELIVGEQINIEELSGGSSAYTITDENGEYLFTAVCGGRYQVSPNVPCFSPASYTFDPLNGSQSGKNFNEIYILGHVYNEGSGNTPMEDVVIKVTGSKTDQVPTDDAGLYVLRRINIGNCVVEPSENPGYYSPVSYVFEPISIKQLAKNFYWLGGYHIEGKVVPADGYSIHPSKAGIKVYLEGDKTAVTYTDADGKYYFGGLYKYGHYRVYPEHAAHYYPYFWDDWFSNVRYCYTPQYWCHHPVPIYIDIPNLYGGKATECYFFEGSKYGIDTGSWCCGYGGIHSMRWYHWPANYSHITKFRISGWMKCYYTTDPNDPLRSLLFYASAWDNEEGGEDSLFSYTPSNYNWHLNIPCHHTGVYDWKDTYEPQHGVGPLICCYTTLQQYPPFYSYGLMWNLEQMFYVDDVDYETTIQTKDATDITVSSATLNAQLLTIAPDDTVTVWFEYGLTMGYGSSTSPTTEYGSLNYQYPASVSSLDSEETYHFRACVCSGGVMNYGDDKTFTTLAE